MQRLQRKKIRSQLIGLSLLLVIVTISTLVAYNPIHSQQSSQFISIEQPFLLKLTVTLAGLALICLELSWFLLSQDRVGTKLASQIFTLLSGLPKQLRIVARWGGWRSNFSSSTLRSPSLLYQAILDWSSNRSTPHQL
ncbi:hypothetical protein [Nostoc sp. 'Peltigera malacea cyanobiont' DB3992]|uniref:hypothetical protein n=1 Tax=Nostoc sp. 'Peltigera malacea cyanobiont' DB3992 TaxID=1206980 RepID=UPI000C0458B4|nr:hypothetical protein [Nostoc sp. 'Peltigera malacea cyanobiont' DB3992]PHM11008.1 hypothetical protein CK516_05100 [Nostoc sp. 'Peltigera malacea cyanobiont' DB3992]